MPTIRETTIESPANALGDVASPKRARRAKGKQPGTYIALVMTLMAAGISGLWALNQRFAPEMYARAGSVRIAEALSGGQNYALFDLNINIREIRDEQIRRMPKAPEVVVLGASHWQEGHVDLLPDHDFYNAHVHRDYYEDMLGMTEIFLRHGKLPRKMIITVRDNLFTPLHQRTDHLWLPILPYYKAMARRLDLVPHGVLDSLPTERWRELLSLSMLHGNVVRWYTANERPHATPDREFKALDVLLPGGSILWSAEHKAAFTQARARTQALEFASQRVPDAPVIDPKGVDALDTLLAFLKAKGVEVYLAHPPFNPLYIERVLASHQVSTTETPYRIGLAAVEDVTRELAEKHGIPVIGTFDGRKLGCTPEMFIDAEHAHGGCLGPVLAQFAEIDRARHGDPAQRREGNETIGEHLTTSGDFTSIAARAAAGAGEVRLPARPAAPAHLMVPAINSRNAAPVAVSVPMKPTVAKQSAVAARADTLPTARVAPTVPVAIAQAQVGMDQAQLAPAQAAPAQVATAQAASGSIAVPAPADPATRASIGSAPVKPPRETVVARRHVPTSTARSAHTPTRSVTAKAGAARIAANRAAKPPIAPVRAETPSKQRAMRVAGPATLVWPGDAPTVRQHRSN